MKLMLIIIKFEFNDIHTYDTWRLRLPQRQFHVPYTDVDRNADIYQGPR